MEEQSLFLIIASIKLQVKNLLPHDQCKMARHVSHLIFFIHGDIQSWCRRLCKQNLKQERDQLYHTLIQGILAILAKNVTTKPQSDHIFIWLKEMVIKKIYFFSCL